MRRPSSGRNGARWEMMPVNIFAYGTLMLPEIVEALTGKCFTPRTAVLCGYSCYAFKDKCYPGIVEEKDGRVEGVFYHDIDERSLSIFDWFEDTLYERRLLTITVDGKNTQAFAYVVHEKYRHELDTVFWSPDTFIRDHAAGYVRKCLGYRKEWESNNHRIY